MNKVLLLFLFISLFIFPSRALEDTDTAAVFTQVLASFRAGSSKDLAKHFEPSILLNLNGQNGNYSKTQAEFILKDFFRKNPPKDFSILYKGGNGNASLYYVGSYISENSQFRVLIKGNPKDDGFRIFSMEILQMNSYSTTRLRD
jgi:hypothetical protein